MHGLLWSRYPDGNEVAFTDPGEMDGILGTADDYGGDADDAAAIREAAARRSGS
jgi:hypothetical protein